MQAKHNYKHNTLDMDTTIQYETMCNSKQVSYRSRSRQSNGSTHTHETSLKDKLSKTATRHFPITKTTCYKNHMGTNMTITQCTDYMLPLSSRFRFIGIKIKPI